MAPAGTRRADSGKRRDTSLSVEHVSDLDGLGQLRPEWNALLHQSRAGSVFLTWEWIATWWEHFGEPGDLLVLAVRDGAGRVVGLAPLRLEHHSVLPFTRARAITFIGLGGPVRPDYLDIIALPPYEESVVSAVLDWLEEQADGWDVIRLRHVAEDSSTTRQFAMEAVHRGYWCLNGDPQPSWFAPLPPTWEEYEERYLRRKTRREIGRRTRRLTDQHEVRTVDLAEEATPEEAIAQIASLHDSRARMLDRGSAFDRPGYLYFHRQVAREAAKQGWLQVPVLLVDGMPAACRYSFAYDGTVYGYQQGFDPSYAQFGVSKTLLAEAIRHSIARGLTRFDLLGGDDAYKAEFCPEQRWQCSYLLAPPDRQGVATLMRRLAGAMRRRRGGTTGPDRDDSRLAAEPAEASMT